jgi:hypothetical protein
VKDFVKAEAGWVDHNRPIKKSSFLTNSKNNMIDYSNPVKKI